MNIILLVTFLGVLLELFLFIKFKLLEHKIKRLDGTGKIRGIEAIRNWKIFIGFLLLTIPLVSVYIYF